MQNKNETGPKAQITYQGECKDQKKKYYKPELKKLGDLRSLTLGTSPVTYLDSGGSGFSEFGGG